MYEKGNEGFVTTIVIISLLAGIASLFGIDKSKKERRGYEEFQKKFTPIVQKYLTTAFQYRDQLRKNYKNLCQKEYQNVLKCAYAKEVLEDQFHICDEKELKEDNELLFVSDEEFSKKLIDKFLKSIKSMKNHNKYEPIVLNVGLVAYTYWNEDVYDDPDYDSKFDKFDTSTSNLKYSGNYYVKFYPLDDVAKFEAYIDLGITANDIKKIIIDANEIKEDKANESLCSNYIYLLDK